MPMFHGHGLKSSFLVPLVCGSGVICSGEFDIPSFFRQMIESLRDVVFRGIVDSSCRSCNASTNIASVRGARLAIRPVRLGTPRSEGHGRARGGVRGSVLERYGMSETCTLTSNPFPPGTQARHCRHCRFQRGGSHRRSGQRGRSGGTSVKSSRVARAYSTAICDDPAATAAAFVNGWFRTGDLGRFDDDGYLTLVGRVKDVINRGGEKIGTLRGGNRASASSGRGRGVRFPDPASDAGRGSCRRRRPRARHAHERNASCGPMRPEC